MTALPCLADKEARRVIAAAALMTSDKDGEALAAVRATCRLLASHNIGPADVFRAALVDEPEAHRRGDAADPSGSQRPRPAAGGTGSLFRQHVQLARNCLTTPEHLSAWEVEFLNGIVGCRSLSPKQRDRLQQIVRAVEMKRWGQ